MRIVFIGGGGVPQMAAKILIEDGHEVVIIEKNKDRIEELSDDLDCGFIHGDGTKPDILKEADPPKTDILFCSTDEDHSNIIANLLAKTLGYQRVVTIIKDPNLENLCSELNLDNTLLPRRMTSRYLAELCFKKDFEDANKLLKNDATLISFIVKDQSKILKEIQLPEKAKILWINRQSDFFFASPDEKLEKDDEVVILTHIRHLEELKNRFN